MYRQKKQYFLERNAHFLQYGGIKKPKIPHRNPRISIAVSITNQLKNRPPDSPLSFSKSTKKSCCNNHFCPNAQTHTPIKKPIEFKEKSYIRI